jgi:hypothetical protein
LLRKEAYEHNSRVSLCGTYKNRIEKFPQISQETKELAFALACDDFDTTEALAGKAEMNSKMPFGGSFLFHCVQFGSTDITCPYRVRWLIDHGIDINLMIYVGQSSTLQQDGTYQKVINFEPPIEYFACYPTVVAVIASRYPKTIDRKNPNTSRTAIGKAAQLGYSQTIEVFYLLLVLLLIYPMRVMKHHLFKQLHIRNMMQLSCW